MGGPVLYSSSTMPAWLTGQSGYMIGPDGRLAAIALDGSTSSYLPPDLAVFSKSPLFHEPSYQNIKGLDSRETESPLEQDRTPWNLPLSISVTGPASAVYMVDDYRLLRIQDGILGGLRQFGSDFSGPVTVSASPMEVVIADSSGKILALDSSGATILWESAGSAVLLSGGMAIFCGADSHLQILESLDGRFIANSDLAGISASIKPTRDESLIFVVLRSGSLAAMDHTGKTKWIAETGMQPFWIINDLKQVYAVSRELLAAFDKVTGAGMWQLPLPVSPAGDPVILPGSIVFAGTDGKVYASVPESGPPAQKAADPGERISAVIGFRLEKYVRNQTELLAGFMPYVDQVAHEGPQAFTIFAYGPVESGGEYLLIWEGEDRDVVLALFNERGDELRANLDEFGAHDSFSYRLDEGGRYFIALGRQDPSSKDEPLFLSVVPARRN
jgi:outer membrane protein assembly factor BamB